MAGLEQELLDKGLVSKDAMDSAASEARDRSVPLSQVLIDRRLVSEADLLGVLAGQHGLTFVSLESRETDSRALRAVSARVATHYGILPLSLRGNVLTIAVSNPTDIRAADDLESSLGLRVERVLATRAEIQAALRRHYGVGADTVERILADGTERGAVESQEATHDLETMAEDASVVRLVNQFIQDAIRDRATDIHIELHRDGMVVRRRIDGVLYDTSVPKNIRVLYPSIVSRIKLMAGLNIVERRLPQDGRARVTVGSAEYDLRVSVVPSLHGEDIVIRLLPATMLFDLANLGFEPEHRVAIEELIARPHGIIFLTGPTGSGKTTTLYACLSRLNTRDMKLITIEDPVEYELKGITQTQVRSAIGLTFSGALRAMLRHDPDIMMVGEVRDRETAEIAIQTAMTGHLVLSTLHTNDAASGAVRLIDMGVEPYLVASTVLAFLAQRLVRMICPQCKEKYQEDGKTLWRGHGCRACANRGFQGRAAICEVLPLLPEIQTLVLARSSAHQIREKATAMGMKTLADDGWRKVEAGLTTRDEVLRVISL